MGCYPFGVVRYFVLERTGMRWDGERRLTINNVEEAGEGDSFLLLRELVRFCQCLGQVHDIPLVACWITCS